MGIYGFGYSTDHTGVWKANLIWPVLAGFPFRFAGTHGLHRLISWLCFFWAFLIIPFGVAWLVTRAFLCLRNPARPLSRKRLDAIILALYVISLFFYVPIPKCLWDYGYWWCSY